MMTSQGKRGRGREVAARGRAAGGRAYFLVLAGAACSRCRREVEKICQRAFYPWPYEFAFFPEPATAELDNPACPNWIECQFALNRCVKRKEAVCTNQRCIQPVLEAELPRYSELTPIQSRRRQPMRVSHLGPKLTSEPSGMTKKYLGSISAQSPPLSSLTVVSPTSVGAGGLAAAYAEVPRTLFVWEAMKL